MSLENAKPRSTTIHCPSHIDNRALAGADPAYHGVFARLDSDRWIIAIP